MQTRASDADRDRVVDALGDHAAAGRLDAQELDERVATALSARTLAELEPLLADLPGPSPRPQRTRVGPRLRPELHAYVAVMVLLVAIWALSGAGYFWPAWPALGWGLGLLAPMGHCGRRRHAAQGRRRLA